MFSDIGKATKTTRTQSLDNYFSLQGDNFLLLQRHNITLSPHNPQPTPHTTINPLPPQPSLTPGSPHNHQATPHTPLSTQPSTHPPHSPEPSTPRTTLNSTHNPQLPIRPCTPHTTLHSPHNQILIRLRTPTQPLTPQLPSQPNSPHNHQATPHSTINPQPTSHTILNFQTIYTTIEK